MFNYLAIRIPTVSVRECGPYDTDSLAFDDTVVWPREGSSHAGFVYV